MAHLEKYFNKILKLGMRNHCSNALVELTNRCNAHCDYCYIVDKTTQDLPTDKIFQIIDKLADAGIMHLCLSGGEIFIRNDIIEILSYIIKKDFWSINLLTNGTLIQDNHLNFLLTHYIGKGNIQISVFSHIPEIHDKYVGIPGAFKKIEYICKQFHMADIKFKLSFNALDINSKSVNETMAYFTNLGYVIHLGTLKIIVQNNSNDKKQNLSRIKKTTSYKFYCSLMENYLPSGIENKIDLLQLTESQKKTKEDTILCQGLFTSICIDNEGNIRPCVSFRNLKIGNIFQNESLHELLEQSKTLKKIKSLRRSDLYPCKHCEDYYNCTICLGRIHSNSGNLNKVSKQFCNYVHALKHVCKT